MSRSQVVAAVIGMLAVGGCANMTDTQRTTATGTGVGAATGAAIGAIVGGGKGAAIGAGVGAAVGTGGGYLWSKRMEQQKQTMETATAGTGVEVTQTPDNQLKLEIPSDLSFDVGKADVKENMRPMLDRFAQTLQANPVTTIRVVGHTDSSGSDAVNDPLSIRRATGVRDYLTAHGVSGSRVAIDGRGSHEPIADNNTPTGRASNRRVEIFVAEAATAAVP